MCKSEGLAWCQAKETILFSLRAGNVICNIEDVGADMLLQPSFWSKHFPQLNLTGWEETACLFVFDNKKSPATTGQRNPAVCNHLPYRTLFFAFAANIRLFFLSSLRETG